MHLLLGLPLVPLILCGAMCLGPALLVMVGLRRKRDTSCPVCKEQARQDHQQHTHSH